MRRAALLVLLFLVPTVQGAILPEAPATQALLDVDTVPLSQLEAGALQRVGFEILESFPVSTTVLVTGPATGLDALEALWFVKAVVQDSPVEPMLSSSRAAAGLPPALTEAGLTGEGVTIALVDAGLDQDHPALADRVLADMAVSEDGIKPDAPTSSEHGTHVGGILVGTGYGSEQGSLAGVASGANLVNMDLSKQFTTSNALRAFQWIYDNHEAYNIQVVANSWGRQRDPATYDPDDPLIQASNALVNEGLVVVFSAGNGGDKPGQMTLEATNPNVITVGAVDDRGNLEAYSSRGPVMEGEDQADWYKPDIVAPGTRIISTRDGGQGGALYKMMNGTSMAAPHVAAAAALLLSVRPDLEPAQVKGILLESSRDVEAPGPDHGTGYGMLDIQAAVSLLEDSEPSTIEHRAVVADEQGELAGPSEAGGLLQVASMDTREQLAFPVRENATALTVHLTWDGDAPLRAVLESPSGRQVRTSVEGEHTFQRDAPEPGSWVLTLESKGLGKGTYETQALVAWEEKRSGTGLPVDVLMRPSSGGFPSMGGQGPFGPSLIPGVPMIVPMTAGAILSVLFLVGRTAWNRRW